MVERLQQGKLEWVDLLNPSQDEVRSVIVDEGVPPELAADFTLQGSRPGVTVRDKVVKVIMDFPIVKRTDIDHPHEVEFIVTKNKLITVRYEEMEAIHRFKKDFEVLTALHKGSKKALGIHLFCGLLNEMYRSLDAKLDYLDSRMSDAEREIFNHREKEMVYTISDINRRLISFRQTIKFHDELLRKAKEIAHTLYPQEACSGLDDIHGQYFLVMRRVNGMSETLDELRETNQALLYTKQNEIMKILTIMAFITFPLSLFTSLFGMNTDDTPITGSNGDFWIIVSIMSVITISFFAFFKYKRWI